jgi:nucleoside-diphosphate-sugar epimerase
MSPRGPLPAGDLDHVVDEAAALWPQLKGARLFITGATGFFGRWLMESLLAADARHGLGVRITALSRSPDAFLASLPHLARPDVSWVRGSVTTLEPGLLGGKKFDMVIHLATEADLQSDPDDAVEVITEGTRRVLEAAGEAGARRFLFTSTGAVYGPQPPGMKHMPEDYPGAPFAQDTAAPYAVPGGAKRQAEILCAEHARRGLGAVIARCFTFAGPALPLDSKFAFGNFMGDALAGRPVSIMGDGTNIRSYLYSADLAVWLWALLLKGVPARPYNVGSEHAVSLLQLAGAIEAELGVKGIKVLQQPRPGAAPDRYIPSTERARQELGLRETVGLGDIIRRTAAWHRA